MGAIVAGTPVLAPAALGVSVLALVVAGFALFYARREANATVDAATTAKKAHAAEMKPQFDASYEKNVTGEVGVIALKLKGPQAVGPGTVSIVSGNKCPVQGLLHEGEIVPEVAIGSLAINGVVRLEVQQGPFAKLKSGKIELVITVSIGGVKVQSQAEAKAYGPARVRSAASGGRGPYQRKRF